MKNIFKLLSLTLFAVILYSCGEDVIPVNADFKAKIAETNYLEVTFENLTEGADTYSWDFGDGTTSTEQNPVHEYSVKGTYTVTLIAENASGGVDQVTKEVTAGSVIADFTTKESRISNFEISFVNESQGAVSYVWDFGDDQTSTEENPIHKYEKEGTYSVTLTVTNSNEESNKVTKDLVVASIFGEYEKGVFVLNQGVFSSNGASITHFDAETNVFTNSVFNNVTGNSLGDVLQDGIIVNDTLAFLALNNSLKVEVINLRTFESVSSIAGAEITYPRYLVDGGNGKVYLSNGTFGGTVVVIDIETLSIEKAIEVGHGPEKMCRVGDKIYVPNSGYYDGATYSNVSDSTMSIIDITTNTQIAKVDMKAKSPRAIVADANNNVWVLCKGVIGYDALWNASVLEEAKLVKYNTTSSEIDKSITIVEMGASATPEILETNSSKDVLYYGGGYGFKGIYSQGIEETNSTLLIDDFSYGFSIDSNNNNIWLLKDDGAKGIATVYDNTGSKTNIEDVEVGRYPVKALFNK